jgi:hypothetical protein
MTTLRVKLIGCGGVGGHVAPHLCRFLHAQRRAAHVALVDGDDFEERNRSRMQFTACDNKAVVLARELAAAFRNVLSIEPVPEYVTARNVELLIDDGDVVFLAVDNHATRQLVDRRCAALREVTLISGGNDGIEEGRDGTYGNVQIVRRVGGRAQTHALGDLHPEIRAPRDRLPSERSCSELAQAGAPQLLFTNLAVASAMLNAFYRLWHGTLDYEEVYLDILQNRVVPVRRARERLRPTAPRSS